MTWREKISKEDPERVDKTEDGGVQGCPTDMITGDGVCVDKCAECWDREVPECYLTDDIVELPHIKDSGDRTQFASGAVRDMRVGKGRCDLLPLDVMADIYAYYYCGDNTREANAIFNAIFKFQDTGNIEYLYRAVSDFELYDTWSDLFLEVAKHFEEGAKKYGDNNWRKGIPVKCYVDSAVRHYLKYLRGDTDEPHDRAFCWNILCAIWTCKHIPELNDYAKKEENSEVDKC